MLKTQKLKQVEAPQPGHGTVLRRDGEGPFFRSTGDLNYICPTCERILVERVAFGQIIDVTFQCVCGAYSEMPDPSAN